MRKDAGVDGEAVGLDLTDGHTVSLFQMGSRDEKLERQRIRGGDIAHGPGQQAVIGPPAGRHADPPFPQPRLHDQAVGCAP